MLLHNCTWSEAEAYIGLSAGILIPIGSTEQHGPNGLIGTDAICSEAMAVRAGDEMDALVAALQLQPRRVEAFIGLRRALGD